MNDQNVTTKIEQPGALCSSDLLACPFCGGPATIEETELLGDVRKSAGCNTEHCQGYQSTQTFSTRREATAAWNSRDDHAAAIGAKWKVNSSLEEWFPMTAERIALLEAEIKECGNAAAIIVKQSQAIEEIRQVATGERQVGNDDTDGLDWIARRIAALKE